MPLYDRKCKECQTTFEIYAKFEDRHMHNCPECGSEAENIMTFNFNRGVVIEPQFFEHLDTKPVWIRGKRHLKEECRKRGLWAKALD